MKTSCILDRDINYVACPGSVILSTTKTGRHDIAESGVKHQNSNNNQYNYIFIWIFKNLFLFTGYGHCSDVRSFFNLIL
jgi:hypothetical protein